MRLLNTTTLVLHEFFGSQIPYYAILSHRWEDGEVTFQDLKSEGRAHLAGWAKITGCCAQAKGDGWEYAVCIFRLKIVLIRSLLSLSGSTPAASISQVVRSFLKLSIACSSSTRTQKYATLICPMPRNRTWTTRKKVLHFAGARGGR